MKETYKIILILLAVFIVGCDKEEFAKLNSDPSTLSEPDLRYSTAKVINDMYTNDYVIWFYTNFDYVYPWSQITGTGVGNPETFVEMAAQGGSQNVYGIIPNAKDIRAKIDALPEEEKVTMRAIKGITFATQVATALTQTDYTGSMVYTEAGLAPYTSPPLITPVYDQQALLFTTWLAELDGAIADLTASEQFSLASQDIVYNGDYGKWAKFCNLLKLRIAARLVNADRSKALSIAGEVANSTAGIMNALDEDFIYKRGINYRGTGNGTQPGTGGLNLVDFLRDNKDPRVRFLFDKNDFNAEVVQAFIDAGRELPSYVEQYVVFDGSGNFESWSGPGEPWVRYHGAPVSPDKQQDGAYDDYFQQASRNRITLGGVEKSYTSTSSFAEKNTRTGIDFTYPTSPGGRLIQKNGNHPALEVILGSSAETNLYLAEFKLLGANVPGSAQAYFNRGVELSIQRMDILAKNSGTYYYENDPVYQDEAMAATASTKLKANEIADLLAQPDYDLSTNGLEKVYIQQYVNFAITPHDTYTTVRRSGIPMVGSSVLAREPFLAAGAPLTIPRRFEIGTPTEDNVNFANAKKSIEEQGFTTGTNDPSILNTQRIWFDASNPNYGEGPKS